MKESCRGCKFWVRNNAKSGSGDCRRLPPQPTFYMDRDGYGNVLYSPITSFPETYEDIWCGEFKERS